MATIQLSRVIQRLRRAAQPRDGDEASDGHLLDCFIAHRDGAAFAALVGRHGPMVLGVCRRVLGNRHDAEDAFQAAFLVLARKADAVRPRELVGNWLYGVAYRTALQARAAKARREVRERQVDTMPDATVVERELWLDLQPILDEELSRLPDKYRVPVVLCELEGQPRKHAARQLDIPEGTLSSRLATARKMLADRLSRRGLALSAGSLSILLAQQASASVPTSLAMSAAQAATMASAGEALAAGLVSTQAAALAQGVIKGMFLSKLKIATAVLLALGLIGTGTGVALNQGHAGDNAAAAAGILPGDDADEGKPKVGGDGNKPKGEGDGAKPKVGGDGNKPKGEGDGNKPKGGEGDKPTTTAGQPVTITGTVSREESKRKRDDGSEILVTNFFVTDAKGTKVMLPPPRGGEAGKIVSNDLAPFVGKKVTLTGTALMVKAGEGDNTQRIGRVLTIKDIKETK